jgi:hypothetical protein
MARSVLAVSTSSSNRIAAAVACASLISVSAFGWFEFTRKANTFDLGTVSRNSDSRLEFNWFARLTKPVTLPRGETCDEALLDRVLSHGEDNRNGRRLGCHGPYSDRAAVGENHCYLTADEVGGQRR